MTDNILLNFMTSIISAELHNLPAYPENRDKPHITFLGFPPCSWMTIVEDYMCDLFSECFWYLVKEEATENLFVFFSPIFFDKDVLLWQ